MYKKSFLVFFMNNLKSDQVAFSARYSSVIAPFAYTQVYFDLDVSDCLYNFFPILQEYFKKDALNCSLGCGYSERNKLEFYPQIGYSINNILLVAELSNISKRKDFFSMFAIMVKKNINIKDQSFTASLKYNPGLGQFTVFFQHNYLSFMDGLVKLSVGFQQPNSSFNISNIFKKKQSQTEEIRQMNLGHLTNKDSLSVLQKLPDLLLSNTRKAILILGNSGTGKSVLANNYIKSFCKENNLHYAKIDLSGVNTGGYTSSKPSLIDYINQNIAKADNYEAACRMVFSSSEVVKIIISNVDLRAELAKSLLNFIDGTLEGCNYKGIPITKETCQFKIIFDDSCTDFLREKDCSGKYISLVHKARVDVRTKIQGQKSAFNIYHFLVEELYDESTEMFIYRFINDAYDDLVNLDMKSNLQLAAYEPSSMKSIIESKCKDSDLIKRLDPVVLTGVPLDLHSLYSLEENHSGFPSYKSEEEIKISLVSAAMRNKFTNTREIVRAAQKLVLMPSKIVGEKLNPCPINGVDFINWEKAFDNDKVQGVKDTVTSNKFFIFASKIYPLDAFLTACSKIIDKNKNKNEVNLELLSPELFVHFDYSLISDISIEKVRKYQELVNQNHGVIFGKNKLKALETLVLYRDKKEQKEKDSLEKNYNASFAFLKEFKCDEKVCKKTWFEKIRCWISTKKEDSKEPFNQECQILFAKIQNLTASKTEYDKHHQQYKRESEKISQDFNNMNNEEFAKIESDFEKSKTKYLNDKAILKSFICSLTKKCSQMRDYNHSNDWISIKNKKLMTQRAQEAANKGILKKIIESAEFVFEYLELKEEFEENDFLDILFVFNGLINGNKGMVEMPLETVEKRSEKRETESVQAEIFDDIFETFSNIDNM